MYNKIINFSGRKYPGKNNLITDVGGLTVGNSEDKDIITGVTTLIPNQKFIASCDIRGGAPASREIDLLDPINTVNEINSIVISGGSVYGLDSASAITSLIGNENIGYKIDGSPISVPIIPAACLFDLKNGGNKNWGLVSPYYDLGVKSYKNAKIDFPLGNYGAGIGAVAGKLKGGIGSASITIENELVIGALVVVNSIGSTVIPGTNILWSSPFEINNEFNTSKLPTDYFKKEPSLIDTLKDTKLENTNQKPRENTTIAIIATNADLTTTELKRLAIMSQAGLARSIRPINSPLDGDIIFTLSNNNIKIPEPREISITELGILAADTLARAIGRSVCNAKSIKNIKSYMDFYTK